MKYNDKHDRYLDNDFNVYYWDKYKDKLMPCKVFPNEKGYLKVATKYSKSTKLHRLIWETFVGVIPEGYEIDHINGVRNDNRLENLQCVTHKENCNNPITIKRYCCNANAKGHKGNTRKRK